MLIGEPTRIARSAGDRAEFAVWSYLEAHAAKHWIIVCNIPEKRGSGRRRNVLHQTDCVVITKNLIYFINIKSHGRSLRVFADQPWQQNGVPIPHKANMNDGFWADHSRQCYTFKEMIKSFGFESCSVVPKIILQSEEVSIEFGSSGLERDVVTTAHFLQEAVRRESGSHVQCLHERSITDLVNWLKDGDFHERIAACRRHIPQATELRPSSPMRVESKGSSPRELTQGVRIEPAPLATPDTVRGSGIEAIRSSVSTPLTAPPPRKVSPSPPISRSERLPEVGSAPTNVDEDVGRVHALCMKKDFDAACDLLWSGVAIAVGEYLEDERLLRALLKPFFPSGWTTVPCVSTAERRVYLQTVASIALMNEEPDIAEILRERALISNVARGASQWVIRDVRAMTEFLENRGLFGLSERLLLLSLELCDATGDVDSKFASLLVLYQRYLVTEMWGEADRIWSILADMTPPRDRTLVRDGDREGLRAYHRFLQGGLTEKLLADAELAMKQRPGSVRRFINMLRGEWLLSLGRSREAAAVLTNALDPKGRDRATEALLLFAKIKSGLVSDHEMEVERFNDVLPEDAIVVAELWSAIGRRVPAIEQALRAHAWAVADGLPHVEARTLRRARRVLSDWGADLPAIKGASAMAAKVPSWELGVRKLVSDLNSRRERRLP